MQTVRQRGLLDAVHAARRLVEEHARRGVLAAAEHHGEGEALALAAREVAGVAVGEVLDADGAQRGRGASSPTRSCST